jgi:hypothetical protein
MSDDLNAKLKAAAEKVVGGKAVTSKFGIDCFGLVDKLLRDLGGKSAGDYGTLTKDADYDWGDGIMLDSIQPGDILQFRNHKVHSSTLQLLDNGKWFETEETVATRPHHTAIVIAVAKEGVTVVEQNIWPDPKKVMRSVIPKLDAGEDTRWIDKEHKIKLKVTGSVRAFHPVPKPPKDASLVHPAGGSRALAYIVPYQGGAKRTPGPLGRDA